MKCQPHFESARSAITISSMDSIIPSVTAVNGGPGLGWSSLKFPRLNSLYRLFAVARETLLLGKAAQKLSWQSLIDFSRFEEL